MTGKTRTCAAAEIARIGRDSTGEIMKIVTWNIRYRNADDAGKGLGWDEVRLARVASMVESLAPDVLAVQEALASQMNDLRAALPAYESVGVGRDDGVESGEFSALFFRRARFGLRGFRTRWLSQTPDLPSRGWDAALPRIATCARLYDGQTKREFEIWDTHFDHRGEVARAQSARYLRAEIGRLMVPALLCGDFNSAPDGTPVKEILSAGNGAILRDARAISLAAPTGSLATFCGFEVPLSGADHRIDYVFATTGWQIESYDVPAWKEGDGAPASDHRPVVVEARLVP